ncbi:MAG: cardiolipin synthase [Prevotellaceae bacterium]|jgi:cardiolipin synthase|nr:cardiolipin synthase [Prevotellaceae bacterium]
MRRIRYRRIFVVFVFLIFNAFVVNGQDFDSDSAVIRFLSAEGIPITENNRVKLLNGGKEKFNDLFQCIKEAKYHIHLEYFNFRNDSIAGVLFNLLTEKAKQGVEVRAVYDAFGNWSNNMPLKKRHLNTIRKNGVEIFPFDPLCFPFVNHISCRDHRKIAVIDGKTAYIGGINIADYYVEGLPEIGEWRDMHLRIEGSAVGYLQKKFLLIWNELTGQEIDGLQYFPSHDDIDGKTVAIIDRIPKKMPRLLEETYLKSIQSAKNSIRIINPYFLPTPAVREELGKAIARNVKVEIMISAKLDIKFTPDGVFHAAHKLMKKGADIYIYNSGFHHSKIMMVDGKFCTVGSANLDYRSLRHDYETNAFIFDREITSELNDIFDADISKSTKMTPEVWKKRSLWKRFVGWIANGLSPVL